MLRKRNKLLTLIEFILNLFVGFQKKNTNVFSIHRYFIDEKWPEVFFL